MIADLCVKHDALCISDEVYEWLTYDGARHVKIGDVPSSHKHTLGLRSSQREIPLFQHVQSRRKNSYE